MNFNRRAMLSGALALSALCAAPLANAQSAPPSPPIEYMQINGAALAYQVHYGPRDAPAMIFVHGYALRSTGTIYRDLLSRLSATHTVYALDLRGHGGSASATAGWSLAQNADDTAAFAAALQLERPVYVGHSLGGFNGMLTELQHPDTFSALALLATVPASGGPDGFDAVADFFVAKGRDQAAMTEAFSTMYVRSQPDEVRRAVEAVILVDPMVHRASFPDIGNHLALGPPTEAGTSRIVDKRGRRNGGLAGGTPQDRAGPSKQQGGGFPARGSYAANRSCRGDCARDHELPALCGSDAARMSGDPTRRRIRALAGRHQSRHRLKPGSGGRVAEAASY